jgi:hypothetical protein
MMGGVVYPALTLAPVIEERPRHGHNQRDDIHLRGTKAISGYLVQALDGDIGTVHGFLADGRTWTITEIIIESGHGLVGTLTRLLTQHIDRISYEDATVYLRITKVKLSGVFGKDAISANPL